MKKINTLSLLIAPMAVAIGLFAFNNCGGGDDDDTQETDAGGSSSGKNDAGNKDSGTEEDAGAEELTACEEPLDNDVALLRPKTTPDEKGGYLLPDGRRITPVGDLIKTKVLPMKFILSPDGKYLIVSNSGDAPHYLSVIDIATKTTVEEINVEALYVGLAFDKNGDLFAAGGQSDKVYRYSFTDGHLELKTSYEVDGFPTWLLFSQDGSKLYVSANTGNKVFLLNGETGEFIKQEISGKRYPYGLALSPDEKWLFWANWGTDSGDEPKIWYSTADEFKDIGSLTVGKNPTQLISSPDGKYIYVLATDADEVGIIDVATKTLVDKIELDDEPIPSVEPVHGKISADGKRLYIACAIPNAIYVVDLEQKKVIGGIPTAWYPTDVELSQDEKELYWLSMKGVGTGANINNESISDMTFGMVGLTSMPDDAQLAANMSIIKENFANPLKFVKKLGEYGKTCKAPGNVLSQNPDYPSPIKHVVFVMKENRTYDQVLSDLDFGERDDTYLMFGEKYTPNTHKFARDYVLFDNFYTESEISVQGHIWTAALLSNDFTERTWPAAYRDEQHAATTGVEPATYPESGFFMEHVISSGLTPRMYGQIVGPGSNPSVLFDYINLSYGFFDNTTKDVDKIQHFIEDLNNDIFPDYVFISLPNDHTVGKKAGSPTPQSMVADNDHALGMMVEAISKSPYWKETLIFVTEDDPQDGADHVDAHRTIALLISPWVKKGHLSSVHYSFVSFFKTAETILGIDPLTAYDRDAIPFIDCFTDQPDFSEYTAITPDVPYEYNIMGEPGTIESMDFDFSLPDQNPDLGKVLWMSLKGTQSPLKNLIEHDDD